MSDTKTPEQMAEDFASEKIGKSWQLGKGSAWLPAITTEQRFDQCVHTFLAGYEAARPKWISVKERLPDKTGRYLVLPVGKCYDEVLSFTKYAFNYDVRIPANSFFYFNGDISHVVDCTHWMDLPDVLKEGEK